MNRKRYAVVILAMVLLGSLGCRSLGPGATARLATIIFTQVTSAEMELSGLAGPSVSLAEACVNSPDDETEQALNELLKGIVIGKVFSLGVKGDPLPWQVLCQGAAVKACENVGLSVVTVWGKPAGVGRLFVATRVRADR